MRADSLVNLYISELQAIHTPQGLAKVLPGLAKAADAPRLAEAFEDQYEQIQRQMDRLARTSDGVVRPEALGCNAIEGLVSEARAVMKTHDEDAVPTRGSS